MIAHLDNYAHGELDFITYAELLVNIFCAATPWCPRNVCKEGKDSLTGAVACTFVMFVREHGTLLLLHMSLKKKSLTFFLTMAGLDDIVEDNTMRS